MNNSENKTESEEFSLTSTTDHDIFLELLTSVGSELGAKFPITLFVKGLMVSGNIISEKEYQKRFADGAIDRTLQKAFQDGELEKKENPESDKKKLTFIHLENAKVLLGTNQIPFPQNEEPIWRGKISSIDGFWLGKVEIRKND